MLKKFWAIPLVFVCWMIGTLFVVHGQAIGGGGGVFNLGTKSSSVTPPTPVVGAHLTDGNQIGGVSGTQNTASITVPANQPTILSVMGFWSSVDAGITIPTAAGTGVTCVQVANTDNKDATTTNWVSITEFNCTASVSTTGALTITWTGSFGPPGSVAWSVDTFSGGSGNVNQALTGTSNNATATSLSITIGALSGGASFGAFSLQGSGTTATKGTGYTQLANNNSSGIWIGLTEYLYPGQTLVNATTNNGADWAGAALEIGGTSLPQPTVIASGLALSSLPKWGTNVHQFENLITPAQMVSLAQGVGANLLRDSVNWDQVESSAGVYNWSGPGFDTEWQTICAAGIYPDIEFTYNNPLYASGIFVTITPGSNTTAYSNYAVAGVNHFIGASFCPSGFMTELGNEVNYTGFWTPQWQGGPYGVFAQSVASAIKTAQPTKVIVSSSGVPPAGINPPQFVAAMIASATMSSIDYYGIHPYSYNEGTPANTNTPQQMLVDIAAYQAQFGSQVKPVAITEAGPPLQGVGTDCTAQSTLNIQGVFIGWSMLNAAIARYPVFIQYDLVDDNTPCTGSDQYTFGLYTNPGASPGLSMKPSGKAFQSVTGAFSGGTSYDLWQFVSQSIYQINVHLSSGSRRIIWQSPAASVVGGAPNIGTPASPINWTEDMGSFSSISAVDLLGNNVSLTVSGTRVTVPLSQGVGPVIVTLH